MFSSGPFRGQRSLLVLMLQADALLKLLYRSICQHLLHTGNCSSMLSMLGEVDLWQCWLPKPFFKSKSIQSFHLKFRVDILRYRGVFPCLWAQEARLARRKVMALAYHEPRSCSWALLMVSGNHSGILLVAKSRQRSLRREWSICSFNICILHLNELWKLQSAIIITLNIM